MSLNHSSLEAGRNGEILGGIYILALFLYSSLSICICNSCSSIRECFCWAQAGSGSKGFLEGNVRHFIVGWAAARAESIFSIILLRLSHCNSPAVTPDCCCDAAPAEQLTEGSRREGVSRAVACKGLPLRKDCSHLCHPDCQHTEGRRLQELVGMHFLTNPQIFIVVHRAWTFLPALASHQHPHHTVCTHFVKIFQNFQKNIKTSADLGNGDTCTADLPLYLYRMECHLMNQEVQ